MGAGVRHVLRDALIPVEDGDGTAFRVFDYIVSYVDEAGKEIDPTTPTIPEATWDFVIEWVDPDDAFAVGLASYARGEAQIAEKALRKATQGSPKVAGGAAFDLGGLLLQQGTRRAWAAAYRQAMSSGVPVPGLAGQQTT